MACSSGPEVLATPPLVVRSPFRCILLIPSPPRTWLAILVPSLPFLISPNTSSTTPSSLCFLHLCWYCIISCQCLAFLIQGTVPSDRFTDYIDPRPRSHYNQPTCSSTGPPDCFWVLHSSPCLSKSRRTSNPLLSLGKHICTRSPASSVSQRCPPKSRSEQPHSRNLLPKRMPYHS